MRIALIFILALGFAPAFSQGGAKSVLTQTTSKATADTAFRELDRLRLVDGETVNKEKNADLPSQSELTSRLSAQLRRKSIKFLTKNEVSKTSADDEAVTEGRLSVDLNAFKSKESGEFVFHVAVKLSSRVRIVGSRRIITAVLWSSTTVGRCPPDEVAAFIYGIIDEQAATIARQWTQSRTAG